MKESVKVNSLKPFMDVEGIDAESEVLRKRFSSKITISPEEDRTCVAVISTQDEDADGDVIVPTGADLKRFTKNPVIMYAHDYSGKPVAKAVALSVTEEGITAKLKFAETEEANDVWTLVKGGFLNANSIGFVIKECHRRGSESFDSYIKENKMKVKDTVARIISKFELLESSIVPIPCNPEALMQAVSLKSIHLSDKTIKELDLPKMVIIEKVVEPVIEKTVAPVIPVAPVAPVAETVIAPVIPVAVPVIEPVELPKGYIKVLRHGGVDVNEIVKLRKLSKLAKLGKIV